MKLSLLAEPELDKGESGPTYGSACSVSFEYFEHLLEMMGSIYDESKPKRATDESGEPLFEDEEQTKPLFRPRTKAEIWFKVAAGLTQGTFNNVDRREEELANRAREKRPPVDVTVL